MRPILFLLISVIFAACGHQKLRFSKVQKKQKVVEISEIPTLKESSESTIAHHSEIEDVKPERYENPASTSIEEDESAQELTLQPSQETSVDFPKTVEDSTRISRAEADAITENALQAEKDGTRSLTFGILFYALLIVTFVVGIIGISLAFGGGEPVFIIVAIVLALLALISLIASMIFGIKSLQSSYNTPKGRKRAIVGIVLSGIGIAFILTNILLSF